MRVRAVAAPLLDMHVMDSVSSRAGARRVPGSARCAHASCCGAAVLTEENATRWSTTPELEHGRRAVASDGYSLVDALITLAVIGTLAAASAPLVSGLTDGVKLGQAAREVERELQTARLKAVSSNRPIRVRFNCPAAGQYRMVELIGTPTAPDAADGSNARCNEATFKTPANDSNPLTRPNLDGPARRLPARVQFGAVRTVEFWPDGSVHQQSASEQPWSSVPVVGAAIALTYGDDSARITVNSIGKITLEP
jgi:type II secretory pathway pseudopilin PulG